MARNFLVFNCLILTIILLSVRSYIFPPKIEFKHYSDEVGLNYSLIKNYQNDVEVMDVLKSLLSQWSLQGSTIVKVEGEDYWPKNERKLRYTFKTTLPEFPNYAWTVFMKGHIGEEKSYFAYLWSHYIDYPRLKDVQKFKVSSKDESKAYKRNEIIEKVKQLYKGKLEPCSNIKVVTSYPYYYLTFRVEGFLDFKTVRIYAQYDHIRNYVQILESSEQSDSQTRIAKSSK